MGVGTAVAIGMRSAFEFDTWWHMAAGRWVVDHGSILRTDPFSFTRAGAEWSAPNWLSDVTLYGVYSLAGVAGVHVLTGLVVGVTALLVWRLSGGPTLIRLGVLGLALVLMAGSVLPRPLLFSFFLTAIFVTSLERARDGRPAWLWWLPPLMALWANLHGSFIIGLGLIAVHALGELLALMFGVGATTHSERVSARLRVRRLVIVGVVASVATVANPHGFTVFTYPFDTLSLSVLPDFVDEWQRTELLSPRGLALILTLGSAAALLRRAGRRMHPTDAILLLGFGGLAFSATRHLGLFGIVAAGIVGRYAATSIPRRAQVDAGRAEVSPGTAAAINRAIVVVVLVALVLVAAPSLVRSPREEAAERDLPVVAVDALRLRPPPSPMFNPYDWGGYLIWTLSPAVPTFIDGRTDLYGDDFVRRYVAIEATGTGWQPVFEDFGIRTALVRPRTPLARALEDAGWCRLHADPVALILTSARSRNSASDPWCEGVPRVVASGSG